MKEDRDEGVKGLRKVKTDLSKVRKMRGRLWVGAERGFSLVELIGVMAVMAILASMAVPPILRQVRQAQSGNEDANLNEVARAIVEGIKATGKIPNPNINPFDLRVGPAIDPGGWADVAYNYTTLTDDTASGGGFAPGTLHYVFPSEPERAYVETARRIYLDPAFLEYLDSQFNGVDPTKTFSTPAGGWPATIAAYGRHPAVNFPNQAIRLYIVSSSRPDFVLSCSANGPNVQDAANNYGDLPSSLLIDQLSSWVKATDPATGFIQAPGTAVENWANNAHQYLHVKTVDLRPLFCRVELIDTACPPTATMTTVGNNYLNGEQISFNVGPAGNLYPFVFTATVDNAGVISWGAGALTANPPLMLTKPFNPNPAITPDPGPPVNNVAFRIYGNSVGAGAEATLASTAAPQFQININNMAAQPFGADNTMVFYVLKGTSLSLLNNAGAILITFTVQGDSTFKYFNSTWSKVD
jgi:prepilin-type N-terminal cleavage/methylation domain-containing protein